MFKAAETLTSFFLEDFAQVGLQYFYFEKFRFRESILIAFITAFMELKRFCYKNTKEIFFDSKILKIDHSTLFKG